MSAPLSLHSGNWTLIDLLYLIPTFSVQLLCILQRQKITHVYVQHKIDHLDKYKKNAI